MFKEFAAALVMTAIIVFFAVQLDGNLDEQSLEVPRFLLCLMAVINVCQYIMAYVRCRQHIDTKLTLAGYPLARVAVLCIITFIYVVTLEIVGFYINSFIYLIAVSLIAQPMKITISGVIKRVVISFCCIGLLYLLFTVGLTVQIPKGIMPF